MANKETFNEFEAYAASVEDANMRFTLTHYNQASWSIAKASIGDALHVQAGFEGSGSAALGATREDGVALYFSRSNVPSVVNGIPLGDRGAFVIPPGSDIALTHHGAHAWASIFVPTDVAAARGLTVGGVARVVETTGALWRLIVSVVGANVLEPAVTHKRASKAAIETSLLSHLEPVLGPSDERAACARGRPRVADRQLVADAVDMVEAGPDLITTCQDLVTATGVSERTLREGFQKYLGVSPRRYIQLSRLHEARRRLTRPGHGGVTVTEVAAGVGMWDFGRFAQRYREAFGESPSHTLARGMAG